MTQSSSRLPAFQDDLSDNYCWGCGNLNDDGLHIESRWEGEESVCVWQAPAIYAAGPRHVLNGGIIATVSEDASIKLWDADTGALRWSHDLVELFDLTSYNAFASSPLAFGDTVILPLGSSQEVVVAFEQDTGAVVWHSERFAVAPHKPDAGALQQRDPDRRAGQGLEVHTRASILTANAWTPPTLVGAAPYVRDRKDILAFDLGR